MEALLIILLELLAPMFAAAFMVIGVFLVTTLEFIGYFLVELLSFLSVRRKSKRLAAEPEKDADPEKPTSLARQSGAWATRASKFQHKPIFKFMLLAPLPLVILIAALAQFVFFEQATRMLIDRVAQKSGYEISFASASGNLLQGSLELQDVSVERPASTKTGFDLQIDDVSIDVALTSLMADEVSIQSLDIDGVSGAIIKKQVTADTSGSGKPRPKKHFKVLDMRLSNVALQIEGGREPHKLEIITAHSQPFRSRLAVLDFFFRSNVEARIDDQPLVITMSGDDDGRKTQWRIDNIPVASLTGLIDRAPIDWMSGGTVSGVVDDYWDLQEKRIDSDVKLTLSNVSIAPPPDAGLREGIAAKALGRVVNAREDDVELAFSFSLLEGEFQGESSLDAKAFGDALLKGLAQSAAAKADERKEAIGDKLKETGGGLLRLLKKDE